MSNECIKALEVALVKKQRRHDKLEALMTEKHLVTDDFTKHDNLAKKFNASKDHAERLRISGKLMIIDKRIQKQWTATAHQNDNYIKWMDEQHALIGPIMELQTELGAIKFRERIR